MVVRFHCGACGQPIEVDDEWASKVVACPYCRRTVKAPAESTLGDLTHIPAASPLGAGGATAFERAGAFQEAGGAASPAAARGVNRMAVAALILAGCSMASLIAVDILVAPHRAELEELQKTVGGAQSFPEKMHAQTAFFEANPQATSWLVPALLLMVIGGLTTLAGMVCALLSLRCPYRRGWSLAALLVTGAVPVFFCCGGGGLGAAG